MTDIRRYRFGLLLAVCLGLLASGCQTDSLDSALDPGAIAPAEPAAPPAEGTVGKGEVHITALLPAADSAAALRDVQDGITMAVEDLGSDVLTISFKAGAAGSKPRELVLGAMAAGPAAIIVPFESAAAADVTGIKGATVTPVFLLNEDVRGATSIYGVPLQSGTSAAAAARALAKDGARTFLLISPKENSAAIEKAVDFAVADHGGRLAAQARFGSDQASLMQAVDTVFNVVKEPDAIVVAGGSNPAAAVAAIRTYSKTVKIVGNSSWTRSLPSADLNGVYVADVDRTELEAVSTRFQARFGHEFTTLAAYAYDVAALSSGIARAVGRDGFVRQIIEDRKGFRGSTGIFRFKADGSNERLLALYQVANGTLKKIKSPPTVF